MHCSKVMFICILMQINYNTCSVLLLSLLFVWSFRTIGERILQKKPILLLSSFFSFHRLVNTMMTRRKWWKILIGTWRKEEIFWERTRWYTLFICQKKMNETKLDRDKSDKTFALSNKRMMSSFIVIVYSDCFLLLFFKIRM